jgi:hypothetical protein
LFYKKQVHLRVTTFNTDSLYRNGDLFANPEAAGKIGDKVRRGDQSARADLRGQGDEDPSGGGNRFDFA